MGNQTIDSNQPVLFDLRPLTDQKERDWTDYDSRGYTVNDKQSEIANSPIAAISLFSGAGGLDIGTQLAGAKVISSSDLT